MIDSINLSHLQVKLSACCNKLEPGFGYLIVVQSEMYVRHKRTFGLADLKVIGPEHSILLSYILVSRAPHRTVDTMVAMKSASGAMRPLRLLRHELPRLLRRTHASVGCRRARQVLCINDPSCRWQASRRDRDGLASLWIGEQRSTAWLW